MFFSVITILVKLHNCITYLCTRTYICSKLSKKICIHNDLTKFIKKQKRGNNITALHTSAQGHTYAVNLVKKYAYTTI